MISPAEQKIIQVDVTNACQFSCANCTRFCGHHKEPYFMDLRFFKKAVASLKGYKGMIGVMGGEPTMHPRFSEIVEYVRGLQPLKTLGEDAKYPIDDFAKWRNENRSKVSGGFGLWTSLGRKYYENFEGIQEAFNYQCVNDHAHKGEHIALMLPYTELGISKDEFVKYRDDCWIQKLWSASITPKGAFFCEVAGALDMLFNGPGGWPVEPDWWKRKPEQFGSQLKWCEICSACLPVPKVRASTGRDLVSPNMRQALEEVGSPKLKAGKVDVLNLRSYDRSEFKENHSCEPYLPLEGNVARVAGTNNTIKPRDITAIVVCVNYDDYLALTLPINVKEVDRILVVTDENDEKTKKLAESLGATVFISKRIHENGAVLAKGKAINDAINSLKNPDWILVMDADVILPRGFLKIKDRVLNPGVLYYTRRFGPEFQQHIKKFMEDLDELSPKMLFRKWASREVAKKTNRKGNAVEAFPYGYFQLWNVRARALAGRNPLYVEGSNNAEWDDSNFGMTVYPEDKVVQLPFPEFDVIHLPHGAFKGNWFGRKSSRLDEIKQMSGWTGKATYVCRTACLANGRLWKPGEKYTGDKEMPNHFELVLE